MKNVAYLKPKKFADHRTTSELSREIGWDITWIRRLEKKGTIPKAMRTKEGVRLWSPAQVEEIKVIKSQQKRGRPKKNA